MFWVCFKPLAACPPRVLMTGNSKKNLQLEKIYFFRIKNYNLPIPSRKDVQSTEEVYCPQKRTSNTSKHEIS
jgi:hypothetical protein